MSVLAILIDDDPDDIGFLTESIKEFDSSIICNSYLDSTEALEWLRDHPLAFPDFIFIDVNMPKIGGVECLRTVRALKELDECIVTVLSTAMPVEVKLKYKGMGANHALCKPVSSTGYLELIRKVLGKPI